MKVQKFDLEKNKYIEVEVIGLVKYVGKSFGLEGLTDGKIYGCIGIEDGMLRIIDDSQEDYLYSASRPASLENPELFGKWEIVTDNDNKELERAIK